MPVTRDRWRSLVPTWLVGALLLGCTSEPQNYDDCILKHVKSGMDRSAVLVVMQSCREKFPAGSSTDNSAASAERDLTPVELVGLTGRAGLSYGNYYSGSIYNGNTGIEVTELEITVTTTIDGEEVTRAYRDRVSIPPQSTADFGFDIIVGDVDASYGWSISGAKGKPTEGEAT